MRTVIWLLGVKWFDLQYNYTIGLSALLIATICLIVDWYELTKESKS